MDSSLNRRGTGFGPGTSHLPAIQLLALALLTLLAFWPVRHNGFILFDDEQYIVHNAVVQRGITPPGVVQAFTKSFAGNWFPLTWLSHMLDVELFGLAPEGHHMVAVAIHLATSLLILLTLRAMTGRAGPSFLVAALFAIHPLRVESVAWAAERKDVLCAFFWMLTLAMYLRYVRRPGVQRYLPVLLCFGLGLMSKQMLVTLPFVLVLLDHWPLARTPGRSWCPAPATRLRLPRLLLEKAPLLALAGLAGLLTLTSQSTVGLIQSTEEYPLAGRVANAILSPVLYLGKTVWPVDLAIFYPYVSYQLSAARVVAAGGFLIATSTAVLLLRRRHPWLLTGWFWYLVTLLPVIGLIQVGNQALADRYTYLPLVGIFIAGAWALSYAGRARSVLGTALAGGIVAVVLLLQVGLTRRQVALWRDNETLFRHALRVTHDNWLAAYFVGVSRERAGDREAAARFLRESIRIRPGFESSRRSLARLFHDDGRDAEALAELRDAVAAIPRSHWLQSTLAGALRDHGFGAERLVALRNAVIALPEDPEMRITLALALAGAGLDEEAIAQFREAIRLWPDIADSYNNLAALLARRGQVAEAEDLLRRALEIDPGYLDARRNLEALTGGGR